MQVIFVQFRKIKLGRGLKGPASRAFRGQAFETMMLVISVIVALAILGVLLNILGGVNTMFTPNDPVDTIKKQLTNIGGQYSPGEAAQEVTLTKDRRIDTTQVIQGNPNILADDLSFAVETSLADDVTLGPSNAYIMPNKNVQAQVVVCGGGNDNKYAVALGRKSKEAEISELCRQTAGIS